MSKYSELMQDDREVVAVSRDWYSDRVGQEGVTKIEVYGESGEYCDIPWFKVYVGDTIVRRSSCHGHMIHYATDTTSTSEDK